MVGRKEPRYFQLVATEAREFAVWPIGRRPPQGWRVVPFAGTIQACGRHVAELRSAGAARAGDGRLSPVASATLVGLLHKAAGEQPDAPALSAGDRRVSYRQLWELVEELAGRLTESGVGPGERVGVAGPVTADLVAAALAVLVIGATCVLSVGDRPDAALAEARPGLVLLPAGSVAASPRWSMVVARWVGVTGTAWQARAALEPAVGAGADDSEASLVMLPSRPGVPAVVWRGRQLAWLAGDCGLPSTGGGDRLLPPFPPGTPATAVVALRALLTGAELVLPERAGGGSADPQRIGPAPIAPVARRWRLRTDRAGGSPDEVEVVGFVETSMLCATVLSGTGDLAPLPQVRRYVLDAQLGPVPPGEVGELYVAGATLAAGYLDQPELTMSRFLPDPLGPVEGGLMFRTGILARRLSDHRFAPVEPLAG
ncbi:AMP-binding protein [Micromonospora sp. KC721]|uniref:AMP-binding protein n=1 Tax=Micromonospora sp. KC721 TaxID=2530380 RepID=UPI001045CCE1|nr:AMP-binding protein [Micromonospora sp. KC721]TDB79407.1 MbtH family NRPS accessory protein [Micromonospora sp. KC721]